ncbi:MAG: AbrB/MazE/SpoVT family DNA-binding domain-containing protein [Gammaproteobacteria bacterium]|nr:AbrB/MazE/SpoVT family DNA-binding domain-containing protein [Gammaproteobacteria bacterium]
MAQLVKIGNSRGIRIPKAIIEQAQLEGKELKIKIVKEGLLVTPSKGHREGWKESIAAILSSHGGSEPVDHEWLDATLTSDEDLQW